MLDVEELNAMEKTILTEKTKSALTEPPAAGLNWMTKKRWIGLVHT